MHSYPVSASLEPLFAARAFARFSLVFRPPLARFSLTGPQPTAFPLTAS
jgi:hypothetical protein